MMSWLALDIGGANLKAADGLGYAAAQPFALWRAPERLPTELKELMGAGPAFDRIAVTMTAELADCYETKAHGVRAILDAAEQAAGGRPIAVYLTDGQFVSAADAREQPQLAAASNWHALAAFANRWANSWPALLLDVGSTTADVIPLTASGPSACSRTDTDRLINGELVYTGVERTPVSAIVQQLPYDGGACPVASELFATAADAYLLLGDLPEEPDNRDTADGRPRTRAAAHARMSRMICADTTTFSLNDASSAASAVRDAQVAKLESAIVQVVDRIGRPPETLLLSGHGEFILRRLVERLPWACEVLSLSSKLGPQLSRCAPAHALAVLARETAERTGE